MPNHRRHLELLDLGLAAVLMLATVAAFAPALAADFVDLDDNAYVTQNPWVQRGLTVDTAVACFTRVVTGNWHPLTMLSHALDCQLWGLRPAGHHLTSVLLHAANVGGLFLLLSRWTGARAPSALAAALFGWHPLRVESVAWVAERKDVLSTALALVALAAYGAWTERPSAVRWSCVALALVGSLLAKPMFVTLPFLLVLLDYWPLGNRECVGADRGMSLRWGLARIREKWMLLAISLVFAVTTLASQRTTAIRSALQVPWSWRVPNALIAVLNYTSQFVWPTRMSVFYPHPGGHFSWTSAAVGLALIVVGLSIAWNQRARRPWQIVGALWYLGMLVPVLGFVQIGGAARADRYTYFPQAGLAIAVAWQLFDWAGADRRRRALVCAVAGAWLALLAALTWRQSGVWHNSETLFRHALEVTGENHVAHVGLAAALVARAAADELTTAKLLHEALTHYESALAIQPRDRIALQGRATVLARLGRWKAAIEAFELAIGQDPANPRLKANYAVALVQTGQLARARQTLEETLALLAPYEAADPALAQLAEQVRAQLELIDQQAAPLSGGAP